MKKLLSLILISCLVVTLFSGCAKENNTNTTEEAEENTKTESLNGEISIVMESKFKGMFNQFIARFNDKYPDVKVNVLYGKDQNQLIAANKAPDLLSTGDLHVVGMKDQFLDLASYIERDKDELKVDDFYGYAFESLKVDGKQLALPTGFNVSLLYYNKDLFDQAGIDYPNSDWTYEDIINAGQKLTLKDDSGKVSQWGVATVVGWWGEWLIHVRQAGGDWMSENGECILDSQEAIAGIQLFYDKTTKGKYQISPSQTDDALGGFAAGKTAMEIGGHTGTWSSINAAGLNWDIAVLPKGLKQKEGSEFAVSAYGVSKDSKNPEAAWEFLKFLASEEGGKMMADVGTPFPRKSVAENLLAVSKDERPNPQTMEALYEAIDTGMTLSSNPNFIPCTQQVVQPFVDKILEGKISVEDGMKEAAKAANEYLEANK